MNRYAMAKRVAFQHREATLRKTAFFSDYLESFLKGLDENLKKTKGVRGVKELLNKAGIRDFKSLLKAMKEGKSYKPSPEEQAYFKTLEKLPLESQIKALNEMLDNKGKTASPVFLKYRRDSQMIYDYSSMGFFFYFLFGPVQKIALYLWGLLPPVLGVTTKVLFLSLAKILGGVLFLSALTLAVVYLGERIYTWFVTRATQKNIEDLEDDMIDYGYEGVRRSDMALVQGLTNYLKKRHSDYYAVIDKGSYPTKPPSITLTDQFYKMVLSPVEWGKEWSFKDTDGRDLKVDRDVDLLIKKIGDVFKDRESKRR
jgi:hypothetical protein